MTIEREQRLQHLQRFLRSIQKPSRSIGSMAIEDRLVESGLIDSLAIVQIVAYLEETYGIDFSTTGVDPEKLASMAQILALIEDMAPKAATS